VVDDPNEQAENDTNHCAGDDGKVKRTVLAAMNDIARKAAEAKWEFPTKEEKCADKQ